MRPHEHYTDAELVQLLLTTQDEALREQLWAEFWYRFHHVIALTVKRRLVRLIGRANLDLVDDLVQETFKKIYEKEILRIFEFRDENALPRYLRVVADNIVRDYIRGIEDEDDIDDIEPPSPDFFDEVDWRLLIQKVENCLQKLAGDPNFLRDYKTFWLYFRDGFTAKEIAHVPGLGFNTVKGVESALLRMIKFLRKCLGPQFSGGFLKRLS